MSFASYLVTHFGRRCFLLLGVVLSLTAAIPPAASALTLVHWTFYCPPQTVCQLNDKHAWVEQITDGPANFEVAVENVFSSPSIGASWGLFDASNNLVASVGFYNPENIVSANPQVYNYSPGASRQFYIDSYF